MQEEGKVLDYFKDVRRWIRKGEQRSNKKKIRSKILQGGQSGLWDAVKMAQNKPQNQIPSNMIYNGQELDTDVSMAQGFANFFKQKVEDIKKSTTVKQNVFNGEKKIDAESENFFTEERV